MRSADRRHHSGATLVQAAVRLARIAVACAVAALTSCRPSHAPQWAVPKAAALPDRVEGSWAIVTGTTGTRVAGELLAAHADTIFVMVGDSLVLTPMQEVRTVELSRYRSNTAAIAGATVLGVLSTASHGWFLILTAPIWTITGTAVAVGDSHVATLDTRNPTALAPWARFPAGLPPSIDRRQLRGVIHPPGG